MAPTPDGIRVTPENAQEVWQRDELKNYTKEELMILAEAKSNTVSDAQESKEVAKKSLEFEENTFKIDSTGWTVATELNSKQNPILHSFINPRRIVKVNWTGDVLEFLDWPAKWEQLFISYDAFIREVMKAKNCTQEEIETKYLMTTDEFQEKMANKPDNSEEYTSFFNKEISPVLPWYKNPANGRFNGVGECQIIRLSHGWVGSFLGTRAYASYPRELESIEDLGGFSGRLLKN